MAKHCKSTERHLHTHPGDGHAAPPPKPLSIHIRPLQRGQPRLDIVVQVVLGGGRRRWPLAGGRRRHRAVVVATSLAARPRAVSTTPNGRPRGRLPLVPLPFLRRVPPDRPPKPAVARRAAQTPGLRVRRRALRRRPLAQGDAAVGGGAEIVVVGLNGQEGAQQLVPRLAPLGNQGAVGDLFPDEEVVLWRQRGGGWKSARASAGRASPAPPSALRPPLLLSTRTSSRLMTLRTYMRSNTNRFFSQWTRCTFQLSSALRLPAPSSLTASRIWASKSSMTASTLSKPGGSFLPRRRRRNDIPGRGREGGALLGPVCGQGWRVGRHAATTA